MRNPFNRNRPQSEFAQQRGDVQRQGSPGLTGLGPPQTYAPVGLPPPPELQVQSVFDTRPISAFDFAFDLTDRFGNELTPVFFVTEAVPAGYVAVLRRVEVEVIQPLLIGTIDPSTSFFQLDLLRNGAVIPFNTVRFRSEFVFYDWPTHHVFGPGETLGVRGSFSLPIINPDPTGVELIGTARMFGTLIPTRNYPPSQEIASPPVLTRELPAYKDAAP